MKQSPARNKRLLTITLLAAAGLLLVGAVSYYFLTGTNANVEQAGPTPTGQPAGPSTTPMTPGQLEPGNSQRTDDNKAPVNSTPSTEANASSGASLTITAANQNGSRLQIRTLIDQIWSQGECRLTLTKDGASVSRSAAVQALPDGATCAGFDIPVSELAPGDWQLSVTAIDNEKNITATQTITIQ